MLHNWLDKVITVVGLLHEKDIFQTYYEQHLAKRLLSGKSLSDQAEGELLAKLRAECGHRFTIKFETMVNDIAMSDEIQKAFRDKMNKAGVELGLDFSARVLTTGSWPAHWAAQCHLPEELRLASEEFERFYLQTRTGRKLTWQTNMGTVSVSATFETGFVKDEQLSLL